MDIVLGLLMILLSIAIAVYVVWLFFFPILVLQRLDKMIALLMDQKGRSINIKTED